MLAPPDVEADSVTAKSMVRLYVVPKDVVTVTLTSTVPVGYVSGTVPSKRIPLRPSFPRLIQPTPGSCDEPTFGIVRNDVTMSVSGLIR